MPERNNKMTEPEKTAIAKWCMKGPGIEIGCGRSRYSDNLLAIDINPEPGNHAGPDLVGDCRLMDYRPRAKGAFGFQDGQLRFILSSHVLEDFGEEEMGGILNEWWRKIRPGGHIVLVLPDMETVGEDGKTPYPRCEEKKPNGKTVGNPSHRVNVGPMFMRELITKTLPDAKVVQCATIDRSKSCSFDLVVQKRKGIK